MGQKTTTDSSDGTDLAALSKALILECHEPARLLELYYWSTEPELLPIVRGFAALPADTRAMLEAFLRVNEPPKVKATIDPTGGIRLISLTEEAPDASGREQIAA